MNFSSHDLALCPSCSSKIKWRYRQEITPDAGMDSFIAAADFDGPLRELVHCFKYKGKEAVGRYLAHRLLKSISTDHLEWDVIVPVPMALWKELKRGYNPALIIGEVLSRETKTFLFPKALARRWHSRSQTDLKRPARFKNAQDSFTLNGGSDSLRNKSVLLVDDVCTTGATLEACAHLLKQAGARRVIGVTIAKDNL